MRPRSRSSSMAAGPRRVRRGGAARAARADGRPGTRRFVHALVQEVVLEQLLGRPGRTAARARWRPSCSSDGGAAPEQLAEHLWAARDIVGADAVDAQLAAADAAVAVSRPSGRGLPARARATRTLCRDARDRGRRAAAADSASSPRCPRVGRRGDPRPRRPHAPAQRGRGARRDIRAAVVVDPLLPARPRRRLLRRCRPHPGRRRGGP